MTPTKALGGWIAACAWLELDLRLALPTTITTTPNPLPVSPPIHPPQYRQDGRGNVLCKLALHDQPDAMTDASTKNATNGYVEGIVRGYRSALLSGQNYGNLTQCETIDGKGYEDTHEF